MSEFHAILVVFEVDVDLEFGENNVHQCLTLGNVIQLIFCSYFTNPLFSMVVASECTNVLHQSRVHQIIYKCMRYLNESEIMVCLSLVVYLIVRIQFQTKHRLINPHQLVS